MYNLQLFNKHYGHVGKPLKIRSSSIPRPGETIVTPPGYAVRYFIVFDVSHYIVDEETSVVVSAVEGDLKSRRVTLSENGYMPEVVGAEFYRYDQDQLSLCVEDIE